MLCRQQGVELVDGYATRNHIHMLLMIPPKYSVANTIGFLKGKSAIRIFRDYFASEEEFHGAAFWGSWILCEHVGLDEQMTREYIRSREAEEKRQELLRLAGL